MKCLAALALLAGLPLPPAQDVEAKKKRLGELFKQMSQIQGEAQKLIAELSGGDPEKERALVMEIMRAHAPGMAEEMDRAQLASNERNAAASLKTLATAQADFRGNDRDNNLANDFWVGDVAGLYRIVGPDGAIQLIESSIARADAKPCAPLDKPGALGRTRLAAVDGPAQAKAGYRFAVVPAFQNERGAPEKHDHGEGRSHSRFAFCAYPAEHGTSGRMTFLITEENVVWQKDTGGKPVDVAPANPPRDGWKKIF